MTRILLQSETQLKAYVWANNYIKTPTGPNSLPVLCQKWISMVKFTGKAHLKRETNPSSDIRVDDKAELRNP